ncbi:hypothetical protein RF657_10225 [Yersinia rochesterensis]|uniref:hypothetical protein n=1 Tax=Yersinia rochesterensis TaxID=1604335 RepID=UPI0028534B2B|nr:hypothetical protein [Yersinia rochesterensis]MDR5018767.1 hypothetical protein [Yersinia rochesterensis]
MSSQLPAIFHFISVIFLSANSPANTYQEALPHHNQTTQAREDIVVHFCDARCTNLVRKNCSILSI